MISSIAQAAASASRSTPAAELTEDARPGAHLGAGAAIYRTTGMPDAPVAQLLGDRGRGLDRVERQR